MLRNMPAREILASKIVEHVNSYYKLGENDYIHFIHKEDKARLKIDNPNIIYNEKEAEKNSYVWIFIYMIGEFLQKVTCLVTIII